MPEVDPARVQRLEQGELLGDHQRGVVGQHHATGADVIRSVTAARWAMSTGGFVLATAGMLWCSATHSRR